MADQMGDREALLEMLGLGGMSAEQAALQRQFRRAQMLRGMGGGNFRSGPGAALGALAQTVGGVAGGLAEAGAERGMQELAPRQAAARARALRILPLLGPEYAGLKGLR